jgi:hypothetical protein
VHKRASSLAQLVAQDRLRHFSLPPLLPATCGQTKALLQSALTDRSSFRTPLWPSPHSRGRPRGSRAVQCMASKPSGSAAVEGTELLLRAATAWVSFTVRAAVRVEIRAWRNAVLWAARTLPDRQAFRRLLLEGRQRRAEERIRAQLGPVLPQPAEREETRRQRGAVWADDLIGLDKRRWHIPEAFR